MRVGIVGCGYVVDDYLRTLPDHPELELVAVTDRNPDRARQVASRYHARWYATTDELLEDSAIQLVVNLTSPESHFEVARAALLAGKHVYGEKPLTLCFEHARELVDLARECGLMLSGAPCALLGDSWGVVQQLVKQGAVGQPKVVYAELDDNPIHLMRPQEWRSESGTPWPYENEFEVGCTLEHASYHVAMLAALFGPVVSVTPFAACLIPDKSPDLPATPPAPDLSVAVLRFGAGVVARLTCSTVAPYDHRLRIIGDEGMVTLDECWHNRSPVHLETFTQLSLNARKLRMIRHSPLLSRLVGIRGRRRPLGAEKPTAGHVPAAGPGIGPSSWAMRVRNHLRRHQMISMDFLLGPQDMARALEEGRDPVMSPEFVLHVTEVTLLISRASSHAQSVPPTTTFAPIDLPTIPGPQWQPTAGTRVSQRLDDFIVSLHNRGTTATAPEKPDRLSAPGRLGD
ncbi:MAG TPA: Gfo/Idh/MocA family oxidoreductase [Nocardioides sp.]|uniref:Gfo/Idh/MocA family protein n=1 Tax=Nocardioides sp. TaxID=35761 RepID=UPI002E36FE3A|nr:Gfo/Idh/MocA family oxidoreductase [Nocardioides sp.]HEX3932332.1 Gfo/Idh/MocA family oxidoreductase [Nocardioides sp.]